MNTYEKDLFIDKKVGFFIYLGVEAIMFITLFATYFIFTPSSEGPHPSEVFSTRTVVFSSIFLLSSSITLMVAEKGLQGQRRKKIVSWLLVTLLFALIFLGFEFFEFRGFLADGYGLSTSSFFSSYYVLVGLHGAHVIFGAVWMIVLLIQLLGINIPFPLFHEKLKIFTYYWHFVDIVWIFIIAIVYLPYLF